ncbi:hypothetical protein SAMN02745206_00973 [Desulfacinum infernum DSM 9756]|uniref:Cyclophilin TM1367-like domain-containing protein n=1 Tax=Desulfacinum infernum DSM 9756 TaxID=1121391 RepID=A0A1M4X409_9BACT|nr:cyclophilin-like fold protein [Desulfacinum infernum]SHE88216.1 hypothetical protein SAMN02745206_00973 [Desulfacinum infernum DSM 9756]
MPTKIRIEAPGIMMDALLNDSPTARRIAEALPLEAEANTWGEEIYFAIPVSEPLSEDAREVVERGDLGYWPTGKAFCIFFGPTPMSRGDEIRPASAVNVVGRVCGDPGVFKSVRDGDLVRIVAAS